MKRVLTPLCIIFALLLSCSPAGEEKCLDEDAGEKVTRTFTATCPPGKASLGADLSLSWEDDDCIWVDGEEFSLIERNGSTARIYPTSWEAVKGRVLLEGTIPLRRHQTTPPRVCPTHR